MKMNLKSNGKMSNRQYHANGKPRWWARVGSGAGAEFLEIDDVRGDEYLDVVVEVDDDVKEISIGVGPRGSHGVRETVTVSPMG
jgi:hypothetical protein